MNKTLAVILIAISACIPAHSKFAYPELKDIPLERLVSNLAERLKEEPANSDALHQLARVHAMAYAKNIADADLLKTWNGWDKKGADEPWFGPMPLNVPYNTAAQAANEKKADSAKTHLATAIDFYKKALTAKPSDNTIKLGLAWCLNQAGENVAATAYYREIAAAAWEEEGGSRDDGLRNFLYVKTADYLIPLLDPAKDANEIAALKERKEKLRRLPRMRTPIIIPLTDHTTLAPLINRDARVRFDLDGTGRQLEWQ